MRSSLLASLVLTSTLTSALAPSIADACGGYMVDPLPAVFAVDDFNVPVPGTQTWQRRSFVVLGAARTAADVAWAKLAPGTYDTTQIADVPDREQSTTFTLIGPSGVRVVSTNRSAHLARTHRANGEQNALEVDADDRSQFQIAVLGTQPDAKWLAATQVAPTKQTRAWIKSQGFEATKVHVSKIKGTTIQVISGRQATSSELTSFVVVDGTPMRTIAGSAIGALDLGSKRYVLIETHGVITPVAV